MASNDVPSSTAIDKHLQGKRPMSSMALGPVENFEIVFCTLSIV